MIRRLPRCSPNSQPPSATVTRGYFAVTLVCRVGWEEKRTKGKAIEKAWQIVRRRPRPFTVTFGNLTLRGVSVGRERSGRSKALNDREESRGGREISFSVAWISCLVPVVSLRR